MKILSYVIGAVLGVVLHYIIVGLGLLISYALDKMSERITRSRYEKKN